MNTLFSNRYVDALVKTIFFFGMIHLVILALIALRENIHVLNAFNILNLDVFVPALGQGIMNFVLSYGMVFVVYSLVFFLSQRSKQENR